MRKQRNRVTTKGFSLVEVVIAIGIVAILLTTFMAVFGPAQKNINRALGVVNGGRLVSTLENEMAVLRTGEESIYATQGGKASAFEKAFQWIKDSNQKNKAIIVYQYQAEPQGENADGTMKAATASAVAKKGSVPGVEYITQTVARKINEDPNGLIDTELVPSVVEGSVYIVKMTQLVKDQQSGGLKLGSVGVIENLDGSNAQNSSDYKEPYITLQAEFFQLNNNLAGFVKNGNWDFDQLGAPVVVQNLAVRR